MSVANYPTSLKLTNMLHARKRTAVVVRTVEKSQIATGSKINSGGCTIATILMRTGAEPYD